ncbi:hypothetical protein ACHAWF_017310 [Thalassiosira exigua]
MDIPLMLLVLLVPDTTNAFLHLSSSIAHPDSNLFVQAPEGDRSDVLNRNSEAALRIDEILRERQAYLLSDTIKLQEQQPQSPVASDNELRRDNIDTDQMVREALLGCRLPIPFLCRSELGQSKIDGAGRGLFAAERIPKGEVITCYPGDALLREFPSSTNDLFHLNEENETDQEEDDFDDSDYVDEVILWGAHVPRKDRWDEDSVFDGTESTLPLTAYAISVDDQYSVCGHPKVDYNPAYYGHFANDGAGNLALGTGRTTNNTQAGLEPEIGEEKRGAEEIIASYVLASLDIANAMHVPLNEQGYHMVTVATRDIDVGEEILVTYGPEYWLGNT